MSTTTSANANRNTEHWDIKHRYTFLTLCHVHRESRSNRDKGGKYRGATFSSSFPSPGRGHTDSAQVDLLFCRLSRIYAVSSTCASWVQLCIFPIKKKKEWRISHFSKCQFLRHPMCHQMLIFCFCISTGCLFGVAEFPLNIHTLKPSQPFGYGAHING